MTPLTLVATLVGVALFFDFLNGFHDASNIVATIISSQAMSPRKALALASVSELVAPFLFGVAVAKTIGRDIVEPGAITLAVILAALFSAIIWNLATWYLGLPSSSSHALIGGLVGAVTMGHGFNAIMLPGLIKVVVALVGSPILGLMIGFIFMKIILFLARGASPRINWFFKRAQIVTSLALALSHGTNDAQKTMGVVTMGLVTAGWLDSFTVPTWVIVAAAGAISLGTATGGWRIIRTLGGGMYRVRPVHGFAAQTCSAAVILGAALLGGPVSTTQVVSSAIMGVGGAERLRRVRWGVAVDIVTAWLITIPASALMAAALYLLTARAWG